MNTIKKTWKLSLTAALVFLWAMCLPVLASPDDNSLAALNVSNGTVTPDFVYSTWEYDVVVEPGTTALELDPVTSDPNASVTGINGNELVDGEATVLVNTISESGIPMTYTLNVRVDEEAAAETEATTETEAAAETQEAVQTEAPTEEQPTEAESQTEGAATNVLQDQVSKLKADSDLMMKIMYGLIAFAVVLLFLIINLILKNRDLKDDLKDAEDQLAYQTNEFARKEKSMGTDSYYAPSNQGEAPQPMRNQPPETPVEQPAAAPQPEPRTERRAPEPVSPEPAPQSPEAGVKAPENGQTKTETKEKKEVNVTMVDL